jgi:hypothetical protein|tara:strand:+ start:602 stop:835 length:234 start_codon:yes stop_codon:yes gene_type:complete
MPPFKSTVQVTDLLSATFWIKTKKTTKKAEHRSKTIVLNDFVNDDEESTARERKEWSRGLESRIGERERATKIISWY